MNLFSTSLSLAQPVAPTIYHILPVAPGVTLHTDIGLTDAGEFEILPEDFSKILPGDFEVLE